MNMSLLTGVSNPEEYYKVDEELNEKMRNEILIDLGVKIE